MSEQLTSERCYYFVGEYGNGKCDARGEHTITISNDRSPWGSTSYSHLLLTRIPYQHIKEERTRTLGIPPWSVESDIAHSQFTSPYLAFHKHRDAAKWGVHVLPADGRNQIFHQNTSATESCSVSIDEVSWWYDVQRVTLWVFFSCFWSSHIFFHPIAAKLLFSSCGGVYGVCSMRKQDRATYPLCGARKMPPWRERDGNEETENHLQVLVRQGKAEKHKAATKFNSMPFFAPPPLVF